MVSAGVTTAMILIVPLLLFFLLKRGKAIIPGTTDSPNCNAATRWCTCPTGESFQFGMNSDCNDCAVECAKRATSAGVPFAPGFDPVGGATGARPFESNMIQGTLQFPLADKMAIPIIAGSVDFDDPTLFDDFAHGFCQCDDFLCCYKAPFQPERGDIRTDEQCEEVNYGDKVQACENAFGLFQDETFDSGVDTNEWINQKVDEHHFFVDYEDDGYPRNRHGGSEEYMDSEMAYANQGGIDAYYTKTHKAFPALLDSDIQTRATNALHRLGREGAASRGLKDNRLRRKLLGY